MKTTTTIIRGSNHTKQNAGKTHQEDKHKVTQSNCHVNPQKNNVKNMAQS